MIVFRSLTLYKKHAKRYATGLWGVKTKPGVRTKPGVIRNRVMLNIKILKKGKSKKGVELFRDKKRRKGEILQKKSR